MANLERWMAPAMVAPHRCCRCPRSSRELFIHHEARGVVLIFGTWNRPLILRLQPLAAAIAAGNVDRQAQRARAEEFGADRDDHSRAFDESEVAVLKAVLISPTSCWNSRSTTSSSPDLPQSGARSLRGPLEISHGQPSISVASRRRSSTALPISPRRQYLENVTGCGH